MNIEDAYTIINNLYAKYAKKEEERKEIVERLVSKSDHIQEKINAKYREIGKIKMKLDNAEIKKKEDNKFKIGMILSLLLSLLVNALINNIFLIDTMFSEMVIGIITTLLLTGVYTVKYTLKNHHFPFLANNEEYIQELNNNLENLKKENIELERKRKAVNGEIQVFIKLKVYENAKDILSNLAKAINDNYGFENYMEPIEEKDEIEWLTVMERKLKKGGTNG